MSALLQASRSYCSSYAVNPDEEQRRLAREAMTGDALAAARVAQQGYRVTGRLQPGQVVHFKGRHGKRFVVTGVLRFGTGGTAYGRDHVSLVALSGGPRGSVPTGIDPAQLELDPDQSIVFTGPQAGYLQQRYGMGLVQQRYWAKQHPETTDPFPDHLLPLAPRGNPFALAPAIGSALFSGVAYETAIKPAFAAARRRNPMQMLAVVGNPPRQVRHGPHMMLETRAKDALGRPIRHQRCPSCGVIRILTADGGQELSRTAPDPRHEHARSEAWLAAYPESYPERLSRYFNPKTTTGRELAAAHGRSQHPREKYSSRALPSSRAVQAAFAAGSSSPRRLNPPPVKLPAHKVVRVMTVREALLEASRHPGARKACQEAIAGFKRFHGRDVELSDQVALCEDNRPGYDAFYVQGRSPEFTYDDVPAGSNKEGSPWGHKTSGRMPTYLIHSPHTDTIRAFGNMRATDWLRG